MTALRLISFSAHGAVEFLFGLVALVAPFVLHAGPAGTVVAVAFGVLLIGLALATTDTALPISTHFAFDYAVSFAAVGAGVLLALSGDRVAALVMGVLAIGHLALNASTRYSARA